MTDEAPLHQILQILERLLARTEQATEAMADLQACMTSLERRVDELLREVQILRQERAEDDDLSPLRVIQ